MKRWPWKLMRSQVKRAAIALAVVFAATAAHAGNFAECILDKMPGSENEAFTTSVISTCTQENPGTFYNIGKGEGRGLFGFGDGNSCIQKKTKETRNQRAAFVIANACRCLHDKSSFDGEMCAVRPFTPFVAPQEEPQAIAVQPAKAEPPKPPPAPILYYNPNPKPIPPTAEDLKIIAAANRAGNEVREAWDRAYRYYPYLATPEGASAKAKILERVDRHMERGITQVIAINRAVAEIAEAHMPREPVHAPETKQVDKPQSSSQSGCRWVTPQQWSCN